MNMNTFGILNSKYANAFYRSVDKGRQRSLLEAVYLSNFFNRAEKAAMPFQFPYHKNKILKTVEYWQKIAGYTSTLKF